MPHQLDNYTSPDETDRRFRKSFVVPNMSSQEATNVAKSFAFAKFVPVAAIEDIVIDRAVQQLGDVANDNGSLLGPRVDEEGFQLPGVAVYRVPEENS